jgi:2-C-methyl-D-erythritol 4-phosphate cytidylyltransferase
MIAVIVAGGVGSRFESSMPKQFYKINEKQIIEYSVEPFLELDDIHKVIIVCHEDYFKHTRLLFEDKKKVSVIVGGKTRFHSSFNALEHIKNNFNCENVLIHDAARPLISKDIIKNCINQLKNHKAVTVAIPATETILHVQNNSIVEIPNREEMYINQTPQCFNFDLIYNCFKNAQHSSFTDDCSVVLGSCNIKIVLGNKNNIKITNKDDVKIMQNYLNE